MTTTANSDKRAQHRLYIIVYTMTICVDEQIPNNQTLEELQWIINNLILFREIKWMRFLSSNANGHISDYSLV